jgi:hypothetical protein
MKALARVLAAIALGWSTLLFVRVRSPRSGRNRAGAHGMAVRSSPRVQGGTAKAARRDARIMAA